MAYAVRRPRYRSASNIGAWSGVLGFLSWLSLPVNALLIAFTSQDLRTQFIIPAIAPGACEASADPFFISDRAKA